MPEFIFVLMHWEVPQQWIDSLAKIDPNIRIESRVVDMYSTEMPIDISDETWAQVTVLFTWKRFPPMEKVPNLRYVQLLSAGCAQLQGLPLYEQTTDIAFCTSNGVHPPQIAEWVFSTFLAFQHHIPEYLDNQKECKWVDPVSDEDTEDAVGLRVGLLGYGAIGRQCGRVAKALGMDVYAYTLHERSTPSDCRSDGFCEPGLGDPEGIFPSKWFAGPDKLHDFLASDLDLLVILLPLTNATCNMIDRHALQLLAKKKAYLSNAGRGAIVDTDAMVDALNTGLLRGAALDVTEPEPLPADHPLWRCKNTIITPHCSGNSTHYNERALRILSYNLQRRADGKDVINRVNKELGY